MRPHRGPLTRPRLLALLILLSAVYLRFDGIGYGLDFEEPRNAVLNYSADERGMVAAELDGFLTGTMEPGSFLMRGTGGFYIFGLADLTLLGTRALLRDQGLGDLRAELGENPSPLHLIHRSVSALAGVLAVLIMMRICQREFGLEVALLSGAMLAVSYLQVREAHMGTVDVLWALLTLMTVDQALLIARTARRRNYALAGLLAGATTATKYFGVFLGLHLIVAHLAARIRIRRSVQTREQTAPPWRLLLLSLGLCPLGFFLLSTYLVVGWRDLLDTARVQTGTIGAGPSAATALEVLWAHGRTTFLAGMGEPVFVLALGGLVLGWLRGGPARLVTLFVLLAAPSLLITNIAPVRFGTAHALLLQIPAALALRELLARLPRGLAPWIVALVLFPSAARSVCFNRVIKQQDTRSEMMAALDSLEVDRSEVVAIGLYGLPRRHRGHDTPYINLVQSILGGGPLTLDAVLRHPPDYLLYDATSDEWDSFAWESLEPMVASRYVERMRVAASEDPAAARLVVRSGGSPAFMVPFSRPCAVKRPGPILILYERIDP